VRGGEARGTLETFQRPSVLVRAGGDFLFLFLEARELSNHSGRIGNSLSRDFDHQLADRSHPRELNRQTFMALPRC